jgi:hypothetical protein
MPPGRRSSADAPNHPRRQRDNQVNGGDQGSIAP